MKTRDVTLLLALLAGAGCVHAHPGATPVGGRYANQVDTYLARQADQERAGGFTRFVVGPVHGRLANGATAAHTMDVRGGTQYVGSASATTTAPTSTSSSSTRTAR